MHFNIIASVALALVPRALACQQYDNHGNLMECEWFGTSPGCGTTGSNIGDTDDQGRVLWQWTKYNDWATFCDIQADRPHNYGNSVSASCCNAYGASCWSGYKRLWCKRS
jgi:hypothetical protein